MAPIEHQRELSFLPLATASAHISFVIFCTGLIARTIYRSSLAIPPSASTRSRQPARKSHVKTFIGLAAASAAFAIYWNVSYGLLSYKVWAAREGVDLPTSLFGDKGAVRGGEHPGPLQLSHWLNDTPIYQDFLEIVTEKARRYWWSQQIDLASISWGLMLSIEGQRRRIPHLWAFMFLAQTLSLSLAQNLFYVAVLLTPIPLPGNVKDLTRSRMVATSSKFSKLKARIISPKPENWCLHPILLLLPVIGSIGAIFLVPFATSTPSFMSISLLAKTLPFLPLVLPAIVPESWGTIHQHPHDLHSAYTKLYRIVSIASLALHGKSTFSALLFNTPDSDYHRHSLLYPYRSIHVHRSKLERYTTGVAKVLGSLGDHPAVGAVGWDALMSGLSLGAWASIRGLDAQQILALSGFWTRDESKSLPKLAEATAKEIRGDASSIAHAATNAIETAVNSNRKRRSRSKASTEVSPPVSPKRGRGRPRKGELVEEAAYQPSQPSAVVEGDEDGAEDWEAGALTWGMLALTGLGVATAGVAGAETTAR